MLQQVKDDAAALTDFAEAIRLAPGVSQLHLERAGTAIRLHDYDLAMEDLQIAEQLEPQQVRAQPDGSCKHGSPSGWIIAARIL